MTNRLQRIQKLIELAEVEMDKAAQTFGFMQTKLVSELEQLASLQNYQDDYAQKPVQMSQISPIQLQTHNAFADKLALAVVAQSNQVSETEKMLEFAEQAWLEKRANVKAMQALYKRIETNQIMAFNKQEQKLLDELSAQKYQQKKSDL